jgi:hypothetical protein
MQIHGYPFAYGVIAFALGLGLWHKKWLHRVAMVLFAAASVLFVLGIVPLQDALAHLTSTDVGLVVLVIVTALAGLAFAVEIRSGRKDSRHLAHICAGITAISGILVFANLARLGREAARSPREAGHALAQTVRGIQTGQAAHAVDSHQALVDLGLAALAVFVLAMLARRREKKTPAKRAPLAITSGRPPSGRPALPNAKGR